MNDRRRFGLDPKIPQRLRPDEELESMIVFEVDNQSLTDLPWYIINPEKTFYKVLDTLIQLTTWITVILTPLIIVYDLLGSDMKQRLHWFLWVTEIAWSTGIFFSFFVSSAKHRTFSKIAINYLKGFFIIDIAATIPPMIYL